MHPLSAAADRLRDMHHGDEMLVLPNAWDAASARLFERMGYPAVATTSAGVAEAIGYADHEATPHDAMFAAVARIAGAVGVPVSADLESGYGLSSETLVESLLGAGAVGLNIEDSVHGVDGETIADPAQHAERLAAIKAAGRVVGVDIVLNARVDSYLHGLGVDDALRRAQAYAAAGADSVYPITATSEEDIAALVEGVDGPVNVMALPAAPPRERLAELGVRRVTFGALLFRGALAQAEQRMREY
jgi:2-methylisocitrate lyase-like PEP mutase family enzyme